MLELRADVPTHGRRVFTDTAGKDEHVDSAEHSRDCSDTLSDRVSEHIDCKTRIRILIACFEQRAHVAAQARYAEKAGLMVYERIEVLDCASSSEQSQEHAGIEVPRSRAHHHASCWSKSHRCFY